ncbi:g1133 [Coccomyxa viridis]|uniref:G1133 protein n=1 Tax=Coccomyxa viridis TaxID=1274662 RepID=A0ABP1FHA7_9CHLO
MQGRNSQRELRKQLSEKCTSTVQNIVKVARSVREESGSEAVADSARRLAAKERFISHSLQAAEQLPHQLVQLDLHLSVVHHHLSNLADSARKCLRLLDEPGQHSSTSRLRTLRLICQTCLRAQDGQWWQVLDLQPGADAKSIKAAVRRLVRIVHPDKCSLSGAEEAFKSVLKAAEHVSASDTDAPLFDYDGGNWWEEWDDPEQLKRKRKAEEMEQQHGEAHTIWWLQLQDLSVQGLQEEVKVLQRDLFKEQSLLKAERQRRLREARVLLNQRLLEAEEAEDSVDATPVETGQGGGFFL